MSSACRLDNANLSTVGSGWDGRTISVRSLTHQLFKLSILWRKWKPGKCRCLHNAEQIGEGCRDLSKVTCRCEARAEPRLGHHIGSCPSFLKSHHRSERAGLLAEPDPPTAASRLSHSQSQTQPIQSPSPAPPSESGPTAQSSSSLELNFPVFLSPTPDCHHALSIRPRPTF